MSQKEFTYRGKTTEELKKLDIREFAKYVPSRERRTVLRQFNEIEKFLNRCKEKIENKKQIKTHLRDIVIVPQMIGMKISVYNGKAFTPVNIEGDMIGHRLGEFSITRTRVHHGSAGVGATKGTKAKAKK
jgi:small subunit ribosomal protein S19